MRTAAWLWKYAHGERTTTRPRLTQEGRVMTLVGCDLHSRNQQVAVLDTDTGEVQERRLAHDDHAVEQFYDSLRRPVTVGV